MILGSPMENLVFWEVDGEIIQKSFDEYAIVGNGFVSKSKDGKVEYYLKYQFTNKRKSVRKSLRLNYGSSMKILGDTDEKNSFLHLIPPYFSFCILRFKGK